ncbi:unnamed protein product [Staurois parvus]|uniref:Uncharacterized protein n=1 Tax=Staurois parvus TaxID=386267 RepID=A0ABN9ETD6_9NEOB|nr:unnamed protein product [Staurois parvus]
MGNDRRHCWGYTDHQGTLIITVSVTACEERNADNRHFLIYMQSAVIWTQLIT